MDDITENFATACLIKVQSFFESKCGNIQLESSILMDGWITLPKMRENTNVVQCINTKTTAE